MASATPPGSPTGGEAYRLALGRAVHALRSARRWSLRVLSQRSGVSVPYLSEIERGRKEPSGDLLGQLAAAFGLSLADLLIAVARELDPRLAAWDPAVRLPPQLQAAIAGLSEEEQADLLRYVEFLRWRRRGPEAPAPRPDAEPPDERTGTGAEPPA